MYINITDSETGDNKGSCARLVEYLEKENQLLSKENSEPERWFNGGRLDIIPQEVRIKIDNNIAKLGRDDPKFFLVNISPSEKETVFLKERFGEKGAEDLLKDFVMRVMDAYAQNFKRAGINNNEDLLWYGKLEHYRYYSHKDPEVGQGLAKTGQRKEGEQMHVQVIVSRKDITNKIKLSPMNNSRGKNETHSAKLGQFDRVTFKQSGELLFEKMFSFDRELKDTMNYALAMKNGSIEEKQKLYLLEQAENKSTDIGKAPDSVKEANIFDSLGVGPSVDISSSSLSGLFDIISLSDPFATEQADELIPVQRKKKKRKYPK
ncbi:molybdopterin-guanine dinucleotide biosynthesis protein MobB [Chryseobacterium angstadtii]|uniref:Molybdopterin-guanine dinucleotide biosynthesis protein MobB n=1 Tax=Chryseobacterium angstadtii TaxID=558151 RepID=A0A0J7IEZ9_9FLAO|nr:DUF5712 family protein [Chryseobacterium angstadtii]KMQ64574.1 molybdopterin-guanine dinucleotide biosynthesis protein MobB [Chryseobacterium angstadtii]